MATVTGMPGTLPMYTQPNAPLQIDISEKNKKSAQQMQREIEAICALADWGADALDLFVIVLLKREQRLERGKFEEFGLGVHREVDKGVNILDWALDEVNIERIEEALRRGVARSRLLHDEDTFVQGKAVIQLGHCEPDELVHHSDEGLCRWALGAIRTDARMDERLRLQRNDFSENGHRLE